MKKEFKYIVAAILFVGFLSSCASTERATKYKKEDSNTHADFK